MGRVSPNANMRMMPFALERKVKKRAECGDRGRLALLAN